MNKRRKRFNIKYIKTLKIEVAKIFLEWLPMVGLQSVRGIGYPRFCQLLRKNKAPELIMLAFETCHQYYKLEMQSRVVLEIPQEPPLF